MKQLQGIFIFIKLFIFSTTFVCVFIIKFKVFHSCYSWLSIEVFNNIIYLVSTFRFYKKWVRLGSEYYIFINFNVKYYLSYHVGVVEVRKNCLHLAIASRRESAYFSFNKSFEAKKKKKQKKQKSKFFKSRGVANKGNQMSSFR